MGIVVDLCKFEFSLLLLQTYIVSGLEEVEDLWLTNFKIYLRALVSVSVSHGNHKKS